MLKTLSVLAFIANTFTGQAQTAPDIQWQKSLGGSNNEAGRSVCSANDGGFIIAGESMSNDGDVGVNHGINDCWVVKLDNQGEMQWQVDLGGSGSENTGMIRRANDGGYIMVGGSTSTDGDVTGNHGDYDVWVVKLDPDGALQWEASYGGSDEDAGAAIQQTSDGGYVIAGGSRSNDGDVIGNQGYSDAWVLKLGPDGTLQWQKTLGGSGGDIAYSIQQTSDGGYIMTGETTSNDGDISGYHGGIDCWVAKLDGSGNLQWQKALGGSGEEEAFSIEQTEEGGYVMAASSGSTDGDVSGGQAIGEAQWIVKLDGNGVIQWQKVLGGSAQDYAWDVRELGDGGYIVAGSTQSEDGQVSGYHGGQFDAWVVRLDSQGTLLWQKALGGSDTDAGAAIDLTDDGGYIIAGSSKSTDGDVTGNHGGVDFWVVKLGPDNVGISELEDAASFSLFPNPSTNAVNVTFNLASAAAVKLRVYDAKGLLVKTLVDEKASPGERTLRYSTEQLPTGTYELRLVSGNSTITKRLVKL